MKTIVELIAGVLTGILIAGFCVYTMRYVSCSFMPGVSQCKSFNLISGK